MKPDEAQLVRSAAQYLGALLSGDKDSALVVQEAMNVAGRSPDAFVLLAIVALETSVLAGEESFEAAISHLGPVSTDFPSEMVRRPQAVELALAVRSGKPVEVTTAAAGLSNVGVALLSALDLALSAVQLLERRTGRSAVQWCSTWAADIAAGVGIDRAPETPS